ncbi:MAG: GNAT family N-acetyltransferase [Oscillospiraceae bacterium]|nr:GNAT family N-acetyltransferase [Oscillospiraceae bacterium]
MPLLPQYQSKGVGAYVINYFLKNLKSRGFTAVALYTNQSNYRAKNCYMKCGFKVSEELTEEMANGNLTKRYKMEIVF